MVRAKDHLLIQISSSQAVKIGSRLLRDALPHFNESEGIELEELLKRLMESDKTSAENDIRDFISDLVERNILLPESIDRSHFIIKLLDDHIGKIWAKTNLEIHQNPLSSASSVFDLGIPPIPTGPLLAKIAVRKNLNLCIEEKEGGEQHFRLKKGPKQTTFRSKFRIPPEWDSRALLVCSNKMVMNYFFTLAGIPVPPQAACGSWRTVRQAADKFGYPVVLKPHTGALGFGVFPNLRTESELESAFQTLTRMMGERDPSVSRNILIEKYIRGDGFRFFVLGDKIIAAYGINPSYVLGDGKNTIQELVDQFNGLEFHEQPTIPIDEEFLSILERQKLTLRSVLPKGTQLQHHYALNWGRGARFERIPLSKIHPKVQQTMVKAVEVAGLHFSALDYVAPSINESPFDNGGAIIEIQPDCNLYHWDVPEFEKLLENFVDYQLSHDMSKPPKQWEITLKDPNS